MAARSSGALIWDYFFFLKFSNLRFLSKKGPTSLFQPTTANDYGIEPQKANKKTYLLDLI